MPATLELNDAETPVKEFFKRAFMGEPQIVTRHGVPSLVIITYADYAATKISAKPRVRSSRKRKSFVDFLRSCPVDLSELDLERDKDTGRNRESIFAEGMFA